MTLCSFHRFVLLNGRHSSTSTIIPSFALESGSWTARRLLRTYCLPYFGCVFVQSMRIMHVRCPLAETTTPRKRRRCAAGGDMIVDILLCIQLREQPRAGLFQTAQRGGVFQRSVRELETGVLEFPLCGLELLREFGVCFAFRCIHNIFSRVGQRAYSPIIYTLPVEAPRAQPLRQPHQFQT